MRFLDYPVTGIKNPDKSFLRNRCAFLRVLQDSSLIFELLSASYPVQ